MRKMRSAGLRSRVRLLVQDGQVLDDNECAEPNESRQADREQNPDKFRLLGVEVRHAHRSSTFAAGNTARQCDGEKAAGRRMVGGPALDFCPALGAKNRLANECRAWERFCREQAADGLGG
jgi:hypothetical protein